MTEIDDDVLMTERTHKGRATRCDRCPRTTTKATSFRRDDRCVIDESPATWVVDEVFVHHGRPMIRFRHESDDPMNPTSRILSLDLAMRMARRIDEPEPSSLPDPAQVRRERGWRLVYTIPEHRVMLLDTAGEPVWIVPLQILRSVLDEPDLDYENLIDITDDDVACAQLPPVAIPKTPTHDLRPYLSLWPTAMRQIREEVLEMYGFPMSVLDAYECMVEKSVMTRR